LIGTLQREPGSFDALLSHYCCSQPKQWFEGRDEPGLTPAVERLAFGEIASSPVEQFLNILIPKRINPVEVPPRPPTLYELPSPEHVDLQVVTSEFPSGLLRAEFDALAASAKGTLELSDEEQRELLRLSAALTDSGDTTDTTKLFDFLRGVTASLGVPRANKYRELLDARVEQLLLGQARSVLARVDGP
jgi:hypothetical protein